MCCLDSHHVASVWLKLSLPFLCTHRSTFQTEAVEIKFHISLFLERVFVAWSWAAPTSCLHCAQHNSQESVTLRSFVSPMAPSWILCPDPFIRAPILWSWYYFPFLTFLLPSGLNITSAATRSDSFCDFNSGFLQCHCKLSPLSPGPRDCAGTAPMTSVSKALSWALQVDLSHLSLAEEFVTLSPQ